MSILIQFLFRMSMGLAFGMAVTSPREVTSGYYRNHLYVLLGLNVLATLIAISAPASYSMWPPLLAGILCYVGSVIWLYEKPVAGILALWGITALSLWGGWQALDFTVSQSDLALWLLQLDVPFSGLVLGVTLAAMLLGHWYLNAPGMALFPLKCLVVWMGVAIALQAIICGVGAILTWQSMPQQSVIFWMLLTVRWLFGIVLAMVCTVMSWQTLKIPNTQSATGILYVAVIGTFLGELVSLMLTSQTGYPL
jgi:hypothetical protein